MNLEVGKHYVSRDGYVWCCFQHSPGFGEHAEFFCVRLTGHRIEYFNADGRYDSDGVREHTLLREALPEEIKRGEALR